VSHPNAAPTDWVAAAIRALTAILAASSGGSAVDQTTLRRALASWKFADRLTPEQSDRVIEHFTGAAERDSATAPAVAVPLVRQRAIVASLTALGCTDRTQVAALLSRAPVFSRLSREEISDVLDAFLPQREFLAIPPAASASATRECEG
jgi:hypothetical protein